MTDDLEDEHANQIPASTTADRRPDVAIPVLGMGASAGGLEAFEQFFRNMPPDSGIAFVLVPHLDPSHASLLTEILQRSTAMPVVEAQDQVVVGPNSVYVIPPNRELTIYHHALLLAVPEEPRGQRMPIDRFLRSLAEDQGENAMGAILSGTGTDGTLGLRAIHGAGGVAFVQDPSTAKYDGMPTSAIQSGVATYVTPVEKMPEQLLLYLKSVQEQRKRPAPSRAAAATGSLHRILRVLRTGTGHDFACYKRSTIGRRIERRMTVNGIERMDVYARYLEEHPQEMQLLFKELLINVTSFFRDPEAFAALRTEVLTQWLSERPDEHTFRIWVPGCSTGEEAYSLAILFREAMDEAHRSYKVQIYATDLDDDVIAAARAGVYPPNIALDVSAERLRRYFSKEETGFRVRKEIRELIVFARQNVIKDPPFTRLDLVSFRNVLIYLEPELQEQLIPTFHYALRPGGVLFLSPSESIGHFPDLFAPVNRKWKLFQALPAVAAPRAMPATRPAWAGDPIARPPAGAAERSKQMDLATLTGKALLQSYAPPSVVTDLEGNLLYVHGETGRFLRPAPGQPTLNVIEMAREGLALELRSAIRSAAAHKEPLVRPSLQVKTNDGFQPVTLTVRRLSELDEAPALLLISFQEQAVRPKRQKRQPAGPDEVGRAAELERELAYTRENLQATVEEMQAANEELKSANEELQSTNEELQSTNEELETSREELQSVNEELVTVNSELQTKIEQLSGMQNDMKNLLDNTDIGMIYLDEWLAIRRFTREAGQVFRLVASDIGRPLADIKSDIMGPDLVDEARIVLDRLAPRELEASTAAGDWYLVRIMPYRTLANVIDGVVLTFTNISELKRAQDAARDARNLAEGIVDTLREPLIVLDGELRVVSASRAFYRFFDAQPQETIGRHLYELGNRQWDIPRLRELLETILPRDSSFSDMRVEHSFPRIGRKVIMLNARQLAGREKSAPLILLAMEDVTDTDRETQGDGDDQ